MLYPSRLPRLARGSFNDNGSSVIRPINYLHFTDPPLLPEHRCVEMNITSLIFFSFISVVSKLLTNAYLSSSEKKTSSKWIVGTNNTKLNCLYLVSLLNTIKTICRRPCRCIELDKIPNCHPPPKENPLKLYFDREAEVSIGLFIFSRPDIQVVIIKNH